MSHVYFMIQELNDNTAANCIVFTKKKVLQIHACAHTWLSIFAFLITNPPLSDVSVCLHYSSCLCSVFTSPGAHCDSVFVSSFCCLPVTDLQFSQTILGRPVPFATAGDCYSAAKCPQVGDLLASLSCI